MQTGKNLLQNLTLSFLFLTLAGAGSACAHAVLDRSLVAPGQTVPLVIAIEHGCNGSPTNSVRVVIPDGMLVVKAGQAQGFRVETRSGPFERAWRGPQTSVSEGVKEIIWSGGSLADKTRGEFPVEIHISADLPTNGILPLPIIQSCQNGENAWTEQAATADARALLKAPAPVLALVKNEQAHLDIRNGRSRVTPNGAPVAGGYVTIRNFGDKADRLIGGALGLAARVEIHEMSMSNGIMRMRMLENGIEIPAGGVVELKQGSQHLMFMKPNRAFVEGEWIEGTLTFERAGTLPVRFKVEGVGGAAHQHHAH